MPATAIFLLMQKKLDRGGGGGLRQPSGILMKRRFSHASRENPRTHALLVYNGIIVHVRTTTTEARL
jgi:hypothetical protein